MKFFSLPIAALLLLICSCNSEPLQRGDALSIDNPTDKDYFVIVDEDTLPLPAHTCIQGFTPVCTGEENITYESGHNPGIHRYRVLDANRKQIFDTSFLSRYRHLLINPTRSTYVEWSIVYGDSTNPDYNDTIMFDNAEYIGRFKTYSGFAIQNKSMKDITCERGIAMTVTTLRSTDDMVQQYMPASSLEIYFLRLQDFLIAYNETVALTPEEDAEVKLHNLLNSFYERTVEEWTHPFRNGEVEQLSGYINSGQYAKAVELINLHSDFFGKHDAEGVREMNDLHTISKNKTARLDPVFSPLKIVKYSYDSQGRPYISETIEYSEIADCVTTTFDAPIE
jgi:hypothetical protein